LCEPIKARPTEESQPIPNSGLSITRPTGIGRHLEDQLGHNPHESTNEIEPRQINSVQLPSPGNRWNQIGFIIWVAICHIFISMSNLKYLIVYFTVTNNFSLKKVDIDIKILRSVKHEVEKEKEKERPPTRIKRTHDGVGSIMFLRAPREYI
jgi:hypothetical protein